MMTVAPSSGGFRSRFAVGPLLIVAVTIAVVAPRPAAAWQGPDAPDGLAAALVLEQAFVQAIERAEPSVVTILRVAPDQAAASEPARHLDDQMDRLEFVPNEFGAGVIIAPEHDPNQRLILTNYHVVKGGPVVDRPPGAERLYVRFHDRRGCRAAILAADPRSDLAVLRLETEGSNVDPARLRPIASGDGGELKKGQLVLVLGNPYALGRDGSATAAWGMIGDLRRRPAPAGLAFDPEGRRDETIHHVGTLLQIAAPLNLGTSGGALLNLQGELIGLTTALAALDGYEKAGGFAIPLDAAARRMVRDLAQGFEVEYGLLGVAPEFGRLPAHAVQASGARIAGIAGNSPASHASLAQGDVILAVNDRPTYSHHDLVREIGLLAPESHARLRVWRGGAERVLTFSATLAKWPVRDEEAIIATARRYPPWRGLAVDYSTARQRFYDEHQMQYPDAVIVIDVAEGSPAERAKLQPGDLIRQVNRVPVRTPAQFQDAVRGLADQEAVLHRLNAAPARIPPE